MERKYKIGYTQGTFDLFHIGHLNLLKNAKKHCDYLIVGVNSDDLVMSYKNKKTIISESDRAEIVNNIKGVDKVYITNTLDKESIYKQIKFDAIFIGDDWKNSERWKETEIVMKKYEVDIVYLEYTQRISSTKIREEINK